VRDATVAVRRGEEDEVMGEGGAGAGAGAWAGQVGSGDAMNQDGTDASQGLGARDAAVTGPVPASVTVTVTATATVTVSA